jgi:hypothetical protein
VHSEVRGLIPIKRQSVEAIFRLRRAGMPREFIQELRGDVRREAIAIYDHIDQKELKESYLTHIPQLGV